MNKSVNFDKNTHFYDDLLNRAVFYKTINYFSNIYLKNYLRKN